MWYTVKQGDTLSAIARTHGVSVDDIMRANPKITDRDKIYAGDVIDVPLISVSFWRDLWKRVVG